MIFWASSIIGLGHKNSGVSKLVMTVGMFLIIIIMLQSCSVADITEQAVHR